MSSSRRPLSLVLLSLFASASCGRQQAAAPPEYRAFSHPERITISGYSGDAMEPFLTGDGRYLLFNNLNEPTVNTDIHYAERIDDLHFVYRGLVKGINTPSLEGVPSVSCEGMLYFISPRSYDKTFSTVYRGRFIGGTASGVELVPGVSANVPGRVNFDAEISADGQTLFVVDSRFRGGGLPEYAKLFYLKADGPSFQRALDSDSIFERVNRGVLQYAPAISGDGLELFFTRLVRVQPGAVPTIWRAVRRTSAEAFEEPALLAAIDGFAEGPALSPDGLSLYYHKKENGTFSLFRVTRPPSPDVHGRSCP